MTETFDKSLNQLLLEFEEGRLDVAEQLEEVNAEMPMTYAYLFADDTEYLNEEEQAQYVFLIALLWELNERSMEDLEELSPEEIQGLEDQAWEWSEMDEHAVVEAAEQAQFDLPLPIVQLINDVADPDLDPAITDAGCDWIFVKGITFYLVLQEMEE